MIEVCLQRDEARIHRFHPFSQPRDRHFDASDSLF